MVARTRLPAGFYKDIFDSVLPRERRIPCVVPPQVLGEYTIERIVAKRFRDRKAFFLVRWKGYDPEEDTWEPKQHLPDDILCKFENPEQHIDCVDDARERLALVIEREWGAVLGRAKSSTYVMMPFDASSPVCPVSLARPSLLLKKTLSMQDFSHIWNSSCHPPPEKSASLFYQCSCCSYALTALHSSSTVMAPKRKEEPWNASR